MLQAQLLFLEELSTAVNFSCKLYPKISILYIIILLISSKHFSTWILRGN